MPRVNRKVLHLALICSAIAASYFDATANGFVWDDVYLVEHNYLITGWYHLYEIFTSGYWACRHGTEGLYRPLTMLSFLVEHSIAGLNPLIYHIDNILLHLSCTVAVYVILRRMFESDIEPLIASMLFAVHPVHAEAVSWVSGRAELLAALFTFLSLYAHIKRRPGRAWSPMSAVFFLLGLLSKESAIVAPVLITVYWLMFEAGGGLRQKLKRGLYLAVPYAVAFIIYMPARLYALQGHEQPIGYMSRLTFYERFLVMNKALTHYIRLAFLPFDLIYDYDYPIPASLLNFEVLFALLVIAALIVLGRRIYSHSPRAAYAIAWFFITLIPVSNIVLIGVIMTERAMYMPTLAACILLGMIFGSAWRYRPAGMRTDFNRYAVLAAITLVLLSFASYTEKHNPFWKNEQVFRRNFSYLMKRHIERYPDYMYFYATYALELETQGDGTDPEIELLAKKAISLDPDYYMGYLALGYTYYSRGMYEEAQENTRKALSLEPYDYDSLNLAGMIYFKLGDLDTAQMYFERETELQPDRPEGYTNKGWLLANKGDWPGAVREFEAAAGYDPAGAATKQQLGMALGACGRYREAVDILLEAVRQEPENEESRYYLAVAYYGLGDIRDSTLELREALRIRPDYPEARSLLESLDPAS